MKNKKSLNKKLALRLLKFLKSTPEILSVLREVNEKEVYESGALSLQTKNPSLDEIIPLLQDVKYKRSACNALVPLLKVWDLSSEKLNELLKRTEYNSNFWRAAVKNAEKSSKKRKPGKTCLDETDIK